MNKITILLFLCISLVMNNLIAQTSQSDIGFVSENGLLTVTNQTNRDLALFISQPSNNLFIGILESSSVQKYDIGRIPNIQKTGMFMIRAVLFDLYKQNRNLTNEDVIFTGFVAYDLENPEKYNYLLDKIIPSVLSETDNGINI